MLGGWWGARLGAVLLGACTWAVRQGGGGGGGRRGSRHTLACDDVHQSMRMSINVSLRFFPLCPAYRLTRWLQGVHGQQILRSLEPNVRVYNSTILIKIYWHACKGRVSRHRQHLLLACINPSECTKTADNTNLACCVFQFLHNFSLMNFFFQSLPHVISADSLTKPLLLLDITIHK